MTAPQGALSNSTQGVDAFLTEASIEALRAELLQRSISDEQLIAILVVPEQIMVNPSPRKFRVIYRKR